MALIVQPQRERGLVFRSGCCPSGGRLRTIDRRHKGGLAHHAAAESGRGRKGFRNAVLRLADRVFLRSRDRKSVVEGKSVSVRVDLGGRGILKQKKTKKS